MGEDGSPIFADYKQPPKALREAAAKQVTPADAVRVSWWWFMGHWEAVQADLMRLYGVRDDRSQDYSWPFFHSLVWSLPHDPTTRVYRLLFPTE